LTQQQIPQAGPGQTSNVTLQGSYGSGSGILIVCLIKS